MLRTLRVNRRRFLQLLGVSGLAALQAACAPERPPDTPSATPAAAGTTLPPAAATSSA